MAVESKQARSATTALVYLTTGALIDVWAVIYYVHLWRNDGSETAFLVCHGCFFSGIVLLCIGLALGRIGNYAKQAEVGHTPNVVVPSPPAAVPVVPAQGNGAMQQTAPVVAVPPVSTPSKVTSPMQATRT